ncbi:keratin, type I cytoskeletal 19 isoform X2 [Myxocyprinus asiaticus]|uniref:keratin, type I cytoskeletal 19 isoform X2 n=1 Tax=Myxocyprinus asiaticus TaxID=70543 RepID=UPI0022219947|nr:keratin, type I cytoskeletal 19 isoform X2 [Myxocyprinus asiaticus]
MTLTGAQHFSGRSFSGRALMPMNVSSFGSSGGFRTGAEGGFRQVYSQSVMSGGLRSSAAVGLGSSAGACMGMGGGSSLSAGFRMIGGSLSAGGSLGGGSFMSGLMSGGGLAETMSFITNEKQQLQVLNDRLATYLEKVKRLETTNLELNEKLRAFTINRVKSSHNLEPYQIQIKPLREKLLVLIQEHARVALAIDNARLAADDFRMKYETELAMRQSVEGDIANLRSLKKEYDSVNATLLQEFKILSEERSTIKDIHQEEMISLRGQMAGTVTVDLMSVESKDLSKILGEIRSEYEAIIEKYRQEAGNWYTKQVDKKTAEVVMITETAVSGSSEITENRKQSLTLQKQLDTVFMERVNLEQRLVEVQAQYQAQIFSLSQLAGRLEGELMSIRESAMQQSRDYQLLLSTKVQLEREISTYKALLEGAGDITMFESVAVPQIKTAVRTIEATSVEMKISEKGAVSAADAGAGSDVVKSAAAAEAISAAGIAGNGGTASSISST